MPATARFGVVLLPESLAEFGPLCREVEELGFDWLGVADSQSVFRELYVSLTLAALNTSRIRLGPLVTNPLTRHLVVTASAVASVDDLSGGRARLGIVKDLQREYDSHHHEIAGGGNAALTERWGLTDFLADRFAFAGTPDDCAAQIRRAMGAGAQQFVITSFVPDPRAFIRRWMREVAPAVG